MILMIHVTPITPEKTPREKIKFSIFFTILKVLRLQTNKKCRSDDNFLILRTLRMVFKGVVGVKNVRTLKNVSKDYLHEVKRGRDKGICFLSTANTPQDTVKVLFNLLRITSVRKEMERRRGCDAGALMARKFLINSRINGIWSEGEKKEKGKRTKI